ncbi:ankyrin repeat-containing domain protein [Aspergillus caelatus]|uniref:Ankyrin repeat-containing domain protein n=1 Tax=Aspergillus caelatus TaxID=61420 RepID=A0A5N7A239_9EURO|nr:ankyrin repeat-containing domain protein [Aspergillus caelatus]KAE8363246.1 ankyrin repeat-containing domain protein [Aspergillus caelatus]
MEAVSAAAAILQVAQMAGQTAIKAHDCFSIIQNAPNEINAINRDIAAFQTQVDRLARSLSSPTFSDIVNADPEISDAILTLESPIANCNEALNRIMQKMEPYLKVEASSPSPKTHGVDSPPAGGTRMRMLWFWRRKEVFGLTMELERTKSTFDNAMGNVKFVCSETTPHPKSRDFDTDVGSSLTNYAASIVAAASNDGFNASSRYSITSAETRAADLPSGPEAAEQIKVAISHGGVLLLRAILQHAHVDARDKKGRTALSHAVEKGQVEIIKVLLECGASVSARQWSVSGWAGGRNPYKESGATAVWYAARYNQLEILKLLLERGANAQVRTTCGNTPLSAACQQGYTDIVKVLLSKGVGVNTRNYHDVSYAPIHGAVSGDFIEILQLLLDHGAFLETPTIQPEGKNALHFSVTCRRLNSLKILLERGADPNALMIERVTPLHLAAAANWIPGIELLMEHNVFIDARDSLLHETPLHKAARNRHHKAIQKLCELGANQQAKNVDGQTYQEILEYALDDPDEWGVYPHLGVYICKDLWLITH